MAKHWTPTEEKILRDGLANGTPAIELWHSLPDRTLQAIHNKTYLIKHDIPRTRPRRKPRDYPAQTDAQYYAAMRQASANYAMACDRLVEKMGQRDAS